MRLLLVLLLAAVTFGDDCVKESSQDEVTGQHVISTDVPRHLVGAVIIVRRADGKESQVPAERFKVVPRKQQFVTKEITRQQRLVCKAEEKKNRLSAVGGVGPKTGFDKSTPTPTSLQVENRAGAVFGLQYQRKIIKDLSVGIQGQSNSTGSILVGIDF
jgi:hypothetical protein